MASPVAVLGTPSSHGGHLITATGFPTINGIPTCVDGDMHACPIDHHGTTPVHSISTLTTIDGRRVIIQGSVAGCGATILVSQTLVLSD